MSKRALARRIAALQRRHPGLSPLACLRMLGPDLVAAVMEERNLALANRALELDAARAKLDLPATRRSAGPSPHAARAAAIRASAREVKRIKMALGLWAGFGKRSNKPARRRLRDGAMTR
jgi:hypothetical protein